MRGVLPFGREAVASEAQAKEEGPQGPSFLSIRSQLDSQYKAVQFLMTEQERERERLARWLRNGETYDDWEVGLEPIPRDTTWIAASGVGAVSPGRQSATTHEKGDD